MKIKNDKKRFVFDSTTILIGKENKLPHIVKFRDKSMIKKI